MMGRPLRIDWSLEDTPEALKAAYQAEHDVVLRTRLHGLWLVRSGWQLGKAATAVGVHYRTVQTWVGWYREGGVEGMLWHKMAGRGKPRFLSPDQERELIEEVSSGRFKTAGVGVQLIPVRFDYAANSNRRGGFETRPPCPSWLQTQLRIYGPVTAIRY